MSSEGVQVTKDPQARRPFGRNWSTWLEAGETLASSTWTSSAPGELTVSGGSFTAQGQTSVWVAGGVAGKTYRITNHVVTTPNGFEDQRSIFVTMKER